MVVIIILTILFSSNSIDGFGYGPTPSLMMEVHYQMKAEYAKVGLNYYQSYLK